MKCQGMKFYSSHPFFINACDSVRVRSVSSLEVPAADGLGQVALEHRQELCRR